MSDNYSSAVADYIRRKQLATTNMVNTPGTGAALGNPNIGIGWQPAHNPYADASSDEPVPRERKFFGQEMVSSDILTYDPKINLLWALGLRLSLAGLYTHLQGRVFAAAPIGDEVHIFIKTKQGKPLLVADSKANFPSDELITKLRMLEG